MRQLVFVGILLVVSATANACSKEWIKLMIMNVCSYSKRHISTSEIPYEQWTKQEINTRFKRIYGDLDEDDENLWEIGEYSESTERKEPERGRKSRMKRFSTLNDGYFNLGVLDRFLRGHDTLEQQQAEGKRKIKRHLRELIDKCCKQVCTTADFQGIC
ncbi:uncharacterized protein [Halyomorpha halys]|uniref:uncharacterized protein n=1 Tax=Halyomorpha halys TaxID=286706 RepID=UPI0006D4EDC4|nr:uncharacterized protein LOC106682844 [Halyomorpha halys]